jgi:Fe-S oxidoreductase
MCCGAGGAQMWKEEEEGKTRVNHERTRQMLKVLPGTGPDCTVATACPFCMTMMSDGLKDLEHEKVRQLDVAEILLRSVRGAAAGTSTDAEPAGEPAAT